jgi:hypothetical protein
VGYSNIWRDCPFFEQISCAHTDKGAVGLVGKSFPQKMWKTTYVLKIKYLSIRVEVYHCLGIVLDA